MNKNSSWLLGVTAFIVVGAVSYQLGKKSATTSLSPDQIEQNVKQDLVALTQKDFEEYQNLKSLEDRYKKADEILGKIVTVFLADIGLKLAFKSTNSALLDASCAIPTGPTLGAVTATTPITSSEASASLSAGTPLISSVAASTPAPDVWKNREASFLEIRDERIALEELRKLEIPDVFQVAKTSKSLGSPEAESIEGSFAGEIKFYDRKEHKRDWNIQWTVVNKSISPVDSSIVLTLTKKGDATPFSTSSQSSGDLEKFMKIPGSRGLLVSVGGENGFIQLYPLNGNPHILVGNYYGKVSLGEFKPQGQVRLNKIP